MKSEQRGSLERGRAREKRRKCGKFWGKVGREGR